MAIHLPGRHAAYEPIGRLRANPFKSGKKSGFVELNLTAMVDMFTVIVIFLIQSFSGEGEISVQKNLVLPDSEKAVPLSERGPVVVIVKNELMLDGVKLASLDDEAAANDPGIPALEERLRAIKEQKDALEAELRRRDPTRAEKGFDGHLIFQADEGTDFALVRRAIFTANQAGWTHLQFAVRKVLADGGGGGEAGGH